MTKMIMTAWGFIFLFNVPSCTVKDSEWKWVVNLHEIPEKNFSVNLEANNIVHFFSEVW
jgi:hypothetical protein